MNDKTWHHYATIWAGIVIIAQAVLQLGPAISSFLAGQHTIITAYTILWPAVQIAVGAAVIAFRKLASNIVAPGILLLLVLVGLAAPARRADATPVFAVERLFPTLTVGYEHTFLPGPDADQQWIEPGMAYGLSKLVAVQSHLGFGIQHPGTRFQAAVVFNARPLLTHRAVPPELRP